MKWRGPDVGTKIDLTRFGMKDGTTLASLMSSGPIVLVSVDRHCAMCRASRDEMNLLREKLTSMGIKYYPVCFVASTPVAEELGVKTPKVRGTKCRKSLILLVAV